MTKFNLLQKKLVQKIGGELTSCGTGLSRKFSTLMTRLPVEKQDEKCLGCQFFQEITSLKSFLTRLHLSEKVFQAIPGDQSSKSLLS